MESAAPSNLSLAAAVLYAVVLAVCLVAATTASRHRQPLAPRRAWLLIALFFAALALVRIGGLEEIVRSTLRAQMQAEGAYEGRRALQGAIFLGFTSLIAALFVWTMLKRFRATRGRRNFALFWAIVAVGSLVALMALRIISFHPVDALLYGPLKLNWVIDIGASLLAMGAAGTYVRLVSSRP